MIDYLLFNKKNEMVICWKIQWCTENQTWDMVILICNKYFILCSIALIYVKIEIWKTTLKLLYMIDYLLFNNKKWDGYLLKNSMMYSKPNLRYGQFKIQQVLYIVLYSSNTCKNRNLENYFKIVVHDWLFVI